MYKVFKENTTFILTKSENFAHKLHSITIYIEEPDSAIEILTNMGNNNKSDVYIIYCDKYKQTIEAIEQHFTNKIAAGGWVFDNNNNLLMIKRLGFWDIPKGHLEKGETLQECAIREVEEETGIKKLKIQYKIGETRHLINKKNSYNLKISHWYMMSSNFNGILTPQKKEDITKAKWIAPENIDKYMNKAWLSLKDFYYESILNSSQKQKD